MKKLVETDFLSIDTVHELTQYVRGELFFFADSVLTLGEHRNKKQLEQMQDFMREVLQLIFKWMQLFPSLVSYYAAPIDDLNLPQTHHQAVALCGAELLDILGKCFGNCARTNNFLNQFEPLREFNPANSVFDQEAYRAKGFKVDLFYTMLELNGFDHITNLLGMKK